MTRILQAVFRHRPVMVLVVLLIAAGGIVSYVAAPKQEYPDIEPPMALLTTQYPGAVPEDVERLVTRKIEEEIESLAGFIKSDSRSVNGLSVVVLELEYGTDIDAAWEDLRILLSNLQEALPEEAHQIHINTDLDKTAGFIIALTNESLDHLGHLDLAEAMERELRQIRGVSRTELAGQQEQQISIRVNSEELNFVPLTLGQISSLIAAQASVVPLGEVAPETSETVRINISQGFTGVDSLRHLVVLPSPETGSVLRLGQIADIQLQAKPDQQRVVHNQTPAILITGFFEEGRNVVFVGRAVRDMLAEFEQHLPSHMKIETILFQPEDITGNINHFMMNFLQGIFFVMLAVLIGMGLRNALVVSSAIPLSILMTLVFMNFFDIYIHQMSIAALIITLGLLVDNAIVVSDAIQVRLDSQEDRWSCCINGARDVIVPVFTSTLTTIGAFIPLLLLDSLAGDFIRSIPQIVVLALTASFIVSMLFIPSVALATFRPRAATKRMARTRRQLNRFAEAGISHPFVSLAILSIAALLAVVLAFQLGLEFFPKADTNMAYIDIRTERDRGIDYTAEMAHEASLVLSEYPEIIQFSTSVGHGFPKFYNALPSPQRSRDYAQIIFRTNLTGESNFRNMTQLTEMLQRDLDGRISGGKAVVRQLEMASPVEAPITVIVSGSSETDRITAALTIREMLESIPGTQNVQDNREESLYEYQVQPDDEAAMRLGITRFDLGSELNLGIMGQDVSSIAIQGRDTEIFLDSTLNSKEMIEGFGIQSPLLGEKIPVRHFAEVIASPQAATIRKHNGQPAVTVTSDVMDGYNAVNIETQLEQMIEDRMPAGVSIGYDGERSEIMKHFGDVGVSAVFAIMIIFLVLVLQFSGFRIPLLILMTIPFSAIGSIAGLWIFRQPLSFTALLGMVSLFGIVVNNAIILMDYIQYDVRGGHDALTACRQAVSLRLRPVLLTTATTVMGLMPLILSGSELFMPMAISLMAGLIVSTLLTLVILPSIYLLTNPAK